jgi:hypothetical protein
MNRACLPSPDAPSRPCRYVSASDVVLVAPIPGYPDTEPVELLPEIWTTVCHVVHTVTISLEVRYVVVCNVPATISDGLDLS